MILAVPALLYAINNYLKFIMQLYFNPATVKMLSNLKVLVIAILLRIIMKCRFSVIQWEALALLLIGISITQMQALPKDSSGIGVPVAMGAYIYTFVFVTVPSLASVFNEYALKSQYDTSIYLQNLFLYGYGAIFNFLGILGTVVLKGPESFDILRGHSKATMLLIINNAGQGILSSFFFKYADTILKKYSSTVATIFTGFASAALFGHTLTINFMLGISIVFISMHQLSASGGRGGPGHWHNPFQYLGDIFWFGPFACNFTGKDIKVEVVFLLEQNQRRRRCKGAGMTFSQTGPFRIQVTCTQCGGSGKYVKSLCKSCNGQRVVRGPKSMKLNIMPDILWSGYE